MKQKIYIYWYEDENEIHPNIALHGIGISDI